MIQALRFLVGAIGLICACPLLADDVDFYRFPLTHAGYYPQQSISVSPSLVDRYGLINVGIHSASKSSVIVDDQTLYVGADSGWFYALHEADLSVKWQFRARPSAKNGIHATAAVDSARVYIADYAGWMYALDKNDGELLWQSKLGDYVGASSVIWKDRICTGVETRQPRGYFACVDRTTGEFLYKSAHFKDHTHSTPSINTHSGVAFIGSNDNYLYALDANTGQQVWRFETGGDIKSTPALHEDSVLATSWDGFLYRIDQVSGEEIWKFQSYGKSMSSPSIDTDEGIVIFGSHDGNVYGVDFETGAEIWKFGTGKSILSSATIVSRSDGNGKIAFIGSASEYIYGLDPKTGKELWRFRSQGRISSVPTIENGRMYVSGDDGWLYVFE